ncbi:MAG: PAS domain-containing protein [Anaerolineaceae bacterium]|nr:PAS domain-containing protein [Anaerolineaceae bacterium]
MESNSQLQRRAQELNVLYGVGKSVASSLDLKRCCTAWWKRPFTLSAQEEGSLMLLDEEQGELYIRASKTWTPKPNPCASASTTVWLVKCCKPNEPSPSATIRNGNVRTPPSLVKSLIYVPLILQNKPIGVLGVTNRLKETSFDSNDTRALSALGGYATIAINNANIYSDIEQQRVTLSVVVDQIDDPVLVVDNEDKLLLLNKAARELFELPEARVVGHPINKLLKNEAAIEFIMQDSRTNLHTTAEIEGADGRIYQARMTLIEGGSRSILMVAKE